jgi:secreted Zn-dependent insulinase-like peptidase
MLNDGHRIQAITIYLQCFQQTLENNALIDLFAHLVNERCFNQLRTKEQLGYVVFSAVSGVYGAQGLQITVQSTYELDYVNRRIELFLDSIQVSRNE